jgi:hypothetical protein
MDDPISPEFELPAYLSMFKTTPLSPACNADVEDTTAGNFGNKPLFLPD